MLLVLELGRKRQAFSVSSKPASSCLHSEFQVSQDNIVRPSLKQTNERRRERRREGCTILDSWRHSSLLSMNWVILLFYVMFIRAQLFKECEVWSVSFSAMLLVGISVGCHRHPKLQRLTLTSNGLILTVRLWCLCSELLPELWNSDPAPSFTMWLFSCSRTFWDEKITLPPLNYHGVFCPKSVAHGYKVYVWILHSILLVYRLALTRVIYKNVSPLLEIKSTQSSHTLCY